MLSHAKDRAPGAVRDVGPPEVLLLLVVSMAGGLMPAAAAVVGGLLPAATVVPGEVPPAGAGVVGVPTACVSVRAALCACAGCCMAAIMLAYMPAVLSSAAFIMAAVLSSAAFCAAAVASCAAARSLNCCCRLCTTCVTAVRAGGCRPLVRRIAAAAPRLRAPPPPPPIELAVEASSPDQSPLSAADIRNVCAEGEVAMGEVV